MRIPGDVPDAETTLEDPVTIPQWEGETPLASEVDQVARLVMPAPVILPPKTALEIPDPPALPSAVPATISQSPPPPPQHKQPVPENIAPGNAMPSLQAPNFVARAAPPPPPEPAPPAVAIDRPPTSWLRGFVVMIVVAATVATAIYLLWG